MPFCGVVGAQTEKVVEFFLDREAAEVQEDEERDRDWVRSSEARLTIQASTAE